MHEVYTSLVIPQAALNLDLAPELKAIDLYPGSRSSDSYEVTWRQLAAVLGSRAPWFDPALRDRDSICAWQPDNPPTIVPANHVELPVRPLLELAADEPDGSPAAAACLWLARHLRHVDAEIAQQNIDEIRAAAADSESDCAYVYIAAVPCPGDTAEAAPTPSPRSWTGSSTTSPARQSPPTTHRPQVCYP